MRSCFVSGGSTDRRELRHHLPMKTRDRICRAALAAAMFAAVVGSAQTKPDARLGSIDFPSSARSPEARSHFIRGVLLLHSFEYPEAAAEFRASQKAEPDFA